MQFWYKKWVSSTQKLSHLLEVKTFFLFRGPLEDFKEKSVCQVWQMPKRLMKSLQYCYSWISAKQYIRRAVKKVQLWANLLKTAEPITRLNGPLIKRITISLVSLILPAHGLVWFSQSISIPFSTQVCKALMGRCHFTIVLMRCWNPLVGASTELFFIPCIAFLGMKWLMRFEKGSLKFGNFRSEVK